MNKRTNSILFLIGATIFNILILFFYFLTFMAISGLLLPVREGWVAQGVWVILFAAALVCAWFTYKLVFRVIKEKVNLERYFDHSIFKNKF